MTLLVSGCGGGQETSSPTKMGSGAQTKSSAELRMAGVLAALEKGPFAQPLDDGLRAEALRTIEITGPSAVDLVSALELVVDTRKAPRGTAVSAHLELYPRPRAAVARGRARIALLEQRGAKVVGGVLSFCGPATLRGEKAWECGGAYGPIYVEATVTPRGKRASSRGTAQVPRDHPDVSADQLREGKGRVMDRAPVLRNEVTGRVRRLRLGPGSPAAPAASA